MKVMVMVEHLFKDTSVVIMQLGDAERRKAMKEDNGMILSPLINEKVGIFFNRKDADERIRLAGVNAGLPASSISANVKAFLREVDNYGFGCRVGKAGDLVQMLERGEVTHLAFAARTSILKFITDGYLFNEHYAVKEETGLLAVLKQTMQEYSTPDQIEALLSDLQK